MNSVANFFRRLSDYSDKVVGVIAMIFLGAMVYAIALQVVARYVFNSPPPWTEEVARYAMVWVGLLGATVSFKAGFDPVLAKIPSNLPRPLLWMVGAIRWLSLLLFLLPILWYSFFGPGANFTRGFLARNWYLEAETFEISTFFVAIGVPIFIIFILLHAVAQGLTPPLPPNEIETDDTL
jgi:TRAP-type C4-dicarboxylate transport system permease small subunit